VPRLTNKEYLAQRVFIQDALRGFSDVFASLSYNDQLTLHTFYASNQDLTDDELIEHRTKITKQQPSLPQRAGKLFGQVFTAAVRRERRLSRPKKQPAKVRVPAGKGHIRIYPLAKPEPDIEGLSQVLLDVARSMEAEERGRAA
jgi:hypothetical protein